MISSLHFDVYHKVCYWYLSAVLYTSASRAAIGPGSIVLYPGNENEVEITYIPGGVDPPTRSFGWESMAEESEQVMQSGWTRVHPCSDICMVLNIHLLPEAWLTQANYIFAHSPYTANCEDYFPLYDGHNIAVDVSEDIDNLDKVLPRHEDNDGEIPNNSCTVVAYTVSQWKNQKSSEEKIGFNIKWVVVLGEPVD
ncbi:hypothetical protein B0H14DRAFT_3666246 [Mycena olivaceomarginata]|nr:hypothetical protein B0H14DRAFT_3666246 [Mycena olivaceomarginata]